MLFLEKSVNAIFRKIARNFVPTEKWCLTGGVKVVFQNIYPKRRREKERMLVLIYILYL